MSSPRTPLHSEGPVGTGICGGGIRIGGSTTVRALVQACFPFSFASTFVGNLLYSGLAQWIDAVRPPPRKAAVGTRDRLTRGVRRVLVQALLEVLDLLLEGLETLFGLLDLDAEGDLCCSRELLLQ
jgi:hypothetical protein